MINRRSPASDELETELRRLFSTIGGGAEMLESVRAYTLECLEEVREEDAVRGVSSNEPFVNLLTYDQHTSSEPSFVFTAFQRDIVAFHVGYGLSEDALERVVQSERGQEDGIESEILRLARFSSTMVFPRPLIEHWLMR